MFVLSTKSSVADKAIAALVATSLVLWGVGVHKSAEAANLIQVSDLVTDSAPGVVSDHTIEFSVPGTGSVGVDADGDAIEVVFPTGFDMSLITAADVEVQVEDTPGTQWTLATSSQTLTITSTGLRVNAGERVDILVGTNAGGLNQVTNHAATSSYEMTIEILDGGTVVQDSGATVLAIIDTVRVSADVDPIFNFYVSGLGTGVDVNGETTTVAGSTTTVPFGTLAPGVPSIVGQQLLVFTNAYNGYSVTVETDQQLTSSNGADIDSYSDGTDVDTSSTTIWAAPTGNISDEKTWGHWGMTSDDATLSGGANSFYDAYYSAVLTTPQEVMYHNTVANGLTAGEGSTTVAYKAEIMSYQEAADDYTATLTYIATPTF